MSSDDVARRTFWTDYMDQMDDLVEQLLQYPCCECHAPMASLEQAMRDAGVEVRFSKTKLGGVLDRIYYVREPLLPDLVAIAEDMHRRGWVLQIEDGFRTQAMQTKLVCSPLTFDQVVRMCTWECGGKRPPVELLFRRCRVMVANYGKTGTHMQGAAVDISVFRRSDGSEVWRGKPYLEMSEYTAMASPFVTEEERANRWAITEIMERHGFMHFPGEFWHYNKGDVLYQILTKSQQPGIYGPIHWDPRTNAITPYDNPLQTLVPLDQLEQELELRFRNGLTT